MSADPECSYVRKFKDAFQGDARRVAIVFLGGVLSCPVCSSPGNVIIHKIDHLEDEEHEKMDQT